MLLKNRDLYATLGQEYDIFRKDIQKQEAASRKSPFTQKVIRRI